jgi:ferritin-like metal-binding protein YciE
MSQNQKVSTGHICDPTIDGRNRSGLIGSAALYGRMFMETLMDLLEDELKDIYNAENQLIKSMPRLAKKATSDTLKEAFATHLEETKNQVARLEKAAEILGIKLRGKVCHAMQGLVEEGKEILEEDGHDNVIDAALIGAAQRVEHYEMAAYGTVIAIAKQLKQREVVDLLNQTLAEEKKTDALLTKISTGEVLKGAPTEEAEEEEE